MEVWRDIKHFKGYQVSNYGRVRTFWKRKHYPTGYGCYWIISDEPRIMRGSDDGNGYLKVMLYCYEDGKRYCRKIHRLVAEEFIEHDLCDDTVDHIRSGPEGKLDNSVNNLRWIPRSENIKKAYRDGVCDERIERQNKPIIAVDLWTGEELYFRSIGEAAYHLRIDRSSISHILRGDYDRTGRYTFDCAGREEKLLYGLNDIY